MYNYNNNKDPRLTFNYNRVDDDSRRDFPNFKHPRIEALISEGYGEKLERERPTSLPLPKFAQRPHESSSSPLGKRYYEGQRHTMMKMSFAT
jgi:hypothetical protein